MIRAAWGGFYIALGAAGVLLYFDAPTSFSNVSLGLAFVCAAPICFNTVRDLAPVSSPGFVKQIIAKIFGVDVRFRPLRSFAVDERLMEQTLRFQWSASRR